MLEQALVGERVRQLRLINGLSATELARLVGISSGSLSLLENGRFAVTNELIANMASSLGCAPAFFGAPDPHQSATQPWLRAYADASKRAVDRILADNALAVQMVEQLGLPRIADGVPLFEGALEDDEAIEALAADARTAANLQDGDIVRNVVRAAERLGCLVLPMDDELGRHLGMSQRIDSVPVIRVARSSEDPVRAIPGDRERFTVAHEIGHLALHHDRLPPDTPADATRYERQAHRFAAAFLAPADPALADLHELGGRVTLNTLAHLKQRWGLSIKAFVVRFRHLGVIDEAHARSLYKQISARGWTKAEPVHVPNEAAQWMQKALASKMGKSTPLGEAETRTGLGAPYFETWCNWSPIPLSDLAQVVDLGARPRLQRKDDAVFGVAPVTQLTIRRR